MKKSWLNGKTVIISGASGGIGFTLAKMLIEQFDCRVIGIARNEAKLKASLETLDKKENFTYRLFDVCDKQAWSAFKEELENNGVTPDVLINNAGFMLPFKKFELCGDEEIDEIISTNFISHVNAVKIMLPLLKKSETPAIINVASSAGMCAVVGESLYCATKFAMRGFTETLQQEYKKTLYVGGIYPGFIRTDILNRMSVSDKENKLINMLMTPVTKACKKMVKGIKRRKKKIVMGVDGRSMTFFGRLFPKMTPSIVTAVLKASKLDLFKDVFND